MPPRPSPDQIGPWKVAYSAEVNKWYWWHEKTRESVWELGAIMDISSQSAARGRGNGQGGGAGAKQNGHSANTQNNQAARTKAAAKRKGSRASDEPGGNGTICPLCEADDSVPEAPELPLGEGGQRRRRQMKRSRSSNKMGMWWKKFGYAGPLYCQRWCATNTCLRKLRIFAVDPLLSVSCVGHVVLSAPSRAAPSSSATT